MKRLRALRTLAALLLAPLLSGAAKPQLVPDVSQREIQIQYSFVGAELLLFGAILYPGGRVPREPADIAVVDQRWRGTPDVGLTMVSNMRSLLSSEPVQSVVLLGCSGALDVSRSHMCVASSRR